MTSIGLALSACANLGINLALREGGSWGPTVTLLGLGIGIFCLIALIAVLRGAFDSSIGLDLVTAVAVVGTTAGVLAHALPSPDTWGSLTSYCALVLVGAGAGLRSPVIFGVSTVMCLGCWAVFGIVFHVTAAMYINLVPVMPLASGLAVGFYLSLRHERSVQAGLVEELRLAADRDQLTGLLNRTGFHARAAVMREMARQANVGAWCAFVDVDHFKTINDDFGHDRGDAALCEVAEALKSLTTTGQIVARWGGDEFVLMGLGDAPTEDQLTRRLNAQALAGTDLAGLPLVTVGVFGSGSVEPWTPDALLAAADSRMYELRRVRRDPSPRPCTVVGQDQ
jgi:diguanylate cyclase (GGDEF)-like protein